MPSKVAEYSRETVEKYKKALEYLDSCPKFTYKDLVETNRIAGDIMLKEKLQQMWEMGKKVIGGAEENRRILRKTLVEGINIFESLAAKTEKKRWQFWK